MPELEPRTPARKMPNVQYTLCIPSTCISSGSCKNLEQITHVAYQIAKAACIYSVGEIVILQVPEIKTKEEETLDTVESMQGIEGSRSKKIYIEEAKSENSTGNSITKQTLLLASLLQFFVTPTYLLKSTFKPDMMRNFEVAKKLPKISNLPFMQNNEVHKDFKEGLTVNAKTVKLQREKTASGKVKKQKNKSKNITNGALDTTKYVNIGGSELLELVDMSVPSNVRVTVNVKTKKIVSPIEAYGLIGARSSFGYHIRVAKQFSSIFTESGYPQGYDKSVYINSGDFYCHNIKDTIELPTEVNIDKSKKSNVLLVLGKSSELAHCFKLDKDLSDVENVKEMFDFRLDIPTGTKIEDGTIISLAALNI